jgi:competence protein ComEC
LLLARVPPGGDWRYGDRISLLGRLITPPEDEDFSYRAYLARQGIFAYMPDAQPSLVRRDQGNRLMAVLYNFKMHGLQTIYRLFPDPEASLFAGILLGMDEGIPKDVEQAFEDSGTAHIIAISGFNMAIVAGLFAGLFGRLLGRRKGALASLIAIGLYTLLVGASASVVRAALMSGLSVFAAQVGRRQDGLNTLAFVAALMALFNPQILWDVGFQLSFLATLGLVLYVGPLTEAFTSLLARRLPPERVQRLARPVGEYFLWTLAALATSLPLTAYYFQRLPLVAPLANLAILPAQAPLMVLGGLAMLVGMFSLPLGQLAAYLAWPFAAYTIRTVEWMAGLPRASIPLGQVNLAVVLLFYVLLFGLTFGRRALGPLRNWPAAVRGAATGAWERLRAAPQGLWVAALVGLLAFTVFVWQAALAAPDGRLHVVLLDVGSGDGLMIQTPGGRFVLVDGGPSPAALSDALGRRLPLGNRRLDYLVVAGTEDEQVRGLARNVERFPPGQVLWAGPTGGTQAARNLSQALADIQMPIVPAEAGQALDLGQGARLRVLDVSRRGAVLLLEWNKFRMLLPVGVDFDSLERLQADRSLAGVSALLLAEGGFAPANPPEWIARLRPGVILLSVAAGDKRNLPDPETLDAIESYTLLRTDQNGWIELSTDGEKMWVEAAR